jgi:hypothetical protein
MVKGADRLDNVRALVHARPAFVEKQVKETRELYYPLMALLAERMPAKYQEKARRLQGLLIEATEAAAGAPWPTPDSRPESCKVPGCPNAGELGFKPGARVCGAHRDRLLERDP